MPHRDFLILLVQIFPMPTTPGQPNSLKSRSRAQRGGRTARLKQPRKDLLIIECDSARLAADRLDLGTLYARLLTHDLVRPFLPHNAVTLIKTSTAAKLLEQFARAIEEHGRSRAILIVGHSNEAGLQLASDLFCNWGTVGEWLQPFEPQFIVLAACESGKSEAVRHLFEPLKKTLRDVYASPVKIYGPQAAALAVLIGMRLWYDGSGDRHSRALRVVNYIGTGGQLYHWSRNETGPGEEVPVEFWDRLASTFEHGHWDLAQIVTDLLQGHRHN